MPGLRYQVLDGHHRFKAYRLAGVKSIPARIVAPANVKVDENLRDWFGKEKWVRMDTKGNIKGDCARGSEKEGKPKCLPQAKAHALGKKGRASAARKKRREDPNPDRKGAAINVATKVREETVDEACWKGYHKDGMKTMFGKRYPNCVKNKNESLEVYVNKGECPGCGGVMVSEDQMNEKKDACYHKVKSRYKVWPSAYASGALVQCRKKGASNWGNKSESVEENTTADGINRALGSFFDPVVANLQRVALLAMQGRQSEAASRLNTAIKTASPDAQKRIIDAVNNIKPVTINGKIADSSTLEKSKEHNEWIIKTFIPWVKSQLEKNDTNEATNGPESKPTMPAGTVRVDVSDVYDWYKLGQHVSNMKGLGTHDFGKGPPSTIISFGSEEAEHKYLNDLKKLGLATTDIDPKDLKQPKGMKKQKVDPTYNVNEDDSDEEIHNYEKLDNILAKLCKMVTDGQESDKDYGMVAAAVLDPDNRIVSRLNRPGKNGKRIHAEHAAIIGYTKQHGDIPEGSIIITTLSPCNEAMDERDGPSCTDLINRTVVKKVYCGYMDPTQTDDSRQFNLMETGNREIRIQCKEFADTFLDHVHENFADGKNPQDKGDSKRYGVPTKASISTLRKFAKTHSGRAAQLAHWAANMKSGKRK